MWGKCIPTGSFGDTFQFWWRKGWIIFKAANYKVDQEHWAFSPSVESLKNGHSYPELDNSGKAESSLMVQLCLMGRNFLNRTTLLDVHWRAWLKHGTCDLLDSDPGDYCVQMTLHDCFWGRKHRWQGHARGKKVLWLPFVPLGPCAPAAALGRPLCLRGSTAPGWQAAGCVIVSLTRGFLWNFGFRAFSSETQSC